MTMAAASENRDLRLKLDELRQSIRELGIHQGDELMISSNGGTQRWLIDLRAVFLRRDNLWRFAFLFWAIYGNRGRFQLAAMETAAIPLLSTLLLTAPPQHAGINGVILRKDRKPTGLGRSLEGKLTTDPVILIDDILNSATSAEKARSIVAAHGGRVSEMAVVIDYRSRRGLAWRATNHIDVRALFSLSEFGLSLENDSPPPRQQYRKLWQTDIPGGFPYHVVPKSAPVLVGDMIFRGADSAKLHAFSAGSGDVLWEFQATGATKPGNKGIWSTPAINQERVYFGAYNGVAYCLDAATGQPIWSQSLCEWIGASPLVIPKHGLAYFGLEFARPWAQGALCALDLATGEKVWERLVQKLQHGSPAYWEGGDLIIWGSADHDMLALEPRSGKVVWSMKTGRSVKYAPTIDEARGIAAFASFDKHIYVLDLKSGRKLGAWETGDICYTTPLIVGSRLFCGSGDRKLYVIDLDTMKVLKTIECGGRVYSSPQRIGNRVIFGTAGGRVYEIDITSLEVAGLLQLPDAITNAVAISADESRIYVSTAMNSMLAYERL
ncbi:PQQ-binding-like beta-propeller repeat protein [Bradyrhizobium sp. SK17]|uniref:outer membrane protein assembly factor BamB family protein n=1 Tax=Bradyrhizobium sp. SK17 TaxID=2057741 RepID=UPI001AED0095|nr:PQQ-binding-like beta-propeller repeat protein [Bradyrhizobium sp. SK17]